MSAQKSFRELVDGIVERHPDTTLGERWAEAQQLDPETSPDIAWHRETPDLVNIVWLTGGSIFDLTWFPSRGMTTLSVLPLRNVLSIEIRHEPGAAAKLGFPVESDLVVTVNTALPRASLLWLGSPDDAEALRSFALHVTTSIP